MHKHHSIITSCFQVHSHRSTFNLSIYWNQNNRAINCYWTVFTMQSSKAKKSIAIKSSWKYELNNANERTEKIFIFHYLFYCAISFTVYDNEKLKLKLIRQFIRLVFSPPFICRAKEGKTAWIFSNLANIKPQMSVEFAMFKNVASIVFRGANYTSLYIRVLFSVAYSNGSGVSLLKMSRHWERIAVFPRLDNNWDKLFSTEVCLRHYFFGFTVA